jgi:exopolysaccharide biosynthesis polyprenyl glycosylphosphotransferase
MLMRADEPTPEPREADGAAVDETAFTGSATARVRALRRTSDRLLTPLSGALLVLAFTGSFTDAVLGLLAFGSAVLVVPARQRWANLLSLMRSPLHATKPVVGVAILAVVEWATNQPGLTAVELMGIGAGTTLAGMAPSILMPQSWAPDRAIRIAVVGPVRVAEELSAELRMEEVPEYTVVGRIAHLDDEPSEPQTVPTLGSLSELAEVVERNDIRLIVFSGDVPRYELFSQVADKLLDLPVRLWELSGFYEDVFGHVPVAEINASWFQYIMHPKYRAVAPRSKRALDIAVSLSAGLALLPVIAIAALLIRRDGGPVLFRQVRIGEGGRPLKMYKLRTMRVEADSGAAQWASVNDPRVTTVGRFLRHTHLDETPQLLNVLRGEMSLVGPRPEQPEFVERLEQFIPFYERRHLLKPGVTGWAQVRCGYAGSDTGSAWKLSHDLYYLKHRSLSFDLAIIGETVRTLFGSRPHRVEPSRFTFVHRAQAEPAPSVPGQ